MKITKLKEAYLKNIVQLLNEDIDFRSVLAKSIVSTICKKDEHDSYSVFYGGARIFNEEFNIYLDHFINEAASYKIQKLDDSLVKLKELAIKFEEETNLAKSYINNEEFIDSIINRINNKQLKK